ncbi:MAG: ABC transporter permease [Bryobacterales bacterium]|nr:ABC transporter permease [Bryobacterales bacterium]
MNLLKGLWSDGVYAARSLAKTRAFTVVCVLSLGIGMAPVIAVPYLARIPSLPPPGLNTEKLVEVYTTNVESRPAANSWAYADYLVLNNSDTGVDIVAWAAAPSMITLPEGLKLPTYPLYVSANYFHTLGIQLSMGSGFERQTDAAVIVSHEFWQTRLSADPAIVGKTLKLDSVPYVVVGVGPEGFAGHFGSKSLFVPLERFPLLSADRNARLDRSKEWLSLHGRLRSGVSIPQANAAVGRVTAQLAKQYPATNRLKSGSVVAYDPLGFDRARFRRLEALALTLTGAVLLVVCLNLSGMMQVRSALRERELSIRQAIGASRWRLARHLLSEAALLALAGGALASFVILNAPAAISRISGQPIPVQLHDALKLDLPMVAVCLAICFAATMVFGLLAALRFSRPAIVSSLKDDAQGRGVRVGRIHRFTAALQVAIALPLLVLGSISLDRVRTTALANLGFDSGVIYAAPLELDAGPEAGNLAFELRGLRDQLARAEGIAAAAVADGLPLDGRNRGVAVSVPQGDAAAAPVRAQVTRVGDGYLDTMGIPLVSGRDFSSDDRVGSAPVAIVTRPLADRLFPHSSGAGNAIGKQVTFGAPPGVLVTIIGVAGDFPSERMNSTDGGQLLLPLAQQSSLRPASIVTDESGNRLPDLMLIARSRAGEQPPKIMAALENVVRSFDPAFRGHRIVTGASLRRSSMDDFLKQSAIAGVTGGVILLLSALGIYGVVGLTVAARTREIAVRVTLGASRVRVLGMILFDVLKLTLPGVAVGLLLVALLLRLNGENMGIPLSDVQPLAYAAGSAAAVAVSLLAGLAPARRAASVLPMVAMRSE